VKKLLHRVLLLVVIQFYLVGNLYSSDSEGNRDDSSLMIGYKPFGVHVADYITTPATLGFYINKNLLFGAEYGSKTFDSETTTSSSYSYNDATFTNSGIYARWFLGNSFNILIAAHSRSLSFSNFSATEGSVTATAETLSYDSKAISLGLGNQWLMDYGLIIGIDWVVATGLISSSATANNVTYSSGSESEAVSIVETDGDEVNALLNLSGVLTFTVGMAF